MPKILLIVLLVLFGCKKASKPQTNDQLLLGRWQLLAASSIPVYLKDSLQPGDMWSSIPPCSDGYFLNFDTRSGAYDTTCNQKSIFNWALSGDSIIFSRQMPDSIFMTRKITYLDGNSLKTSRLNIPANDTPVLIFESYIHR